MAGGASKAATVIGSRRIVSLLLLQWLFAAAIIMAYIHHLATKK